MLTARDEYSLRSFGPRSVKTSSFDKAIGIYRDTTGGGVKTDASQIVYWAERTNEDFSKDGDQVHILGLLREREIVGFALTFYIPGQKLFVVDHIAITPSARSMTAFERFCDLIARYVKEESLYIDYFVGEVSIDVNEGDPLLNAETLTRLLQLKGFRVVDCTYFTPSAERIPPYRSVKAKLLLHSTAETRITSAKLLNIIESMHEGLYKNWYKPFSRDFEKYCAHLREIRERIEMDLGNKEYASLDGHPFVRGNVTINDLPHKQIVIFTYVILAVTLAIAVATFVSWTGIGLISIVGGAVAVAICTLVILALWYESAAKLVKYGIDGLISVFGRRK
jgi:hypothetical protein